MINIGKALYKNRHYYYFFNFFFYFSRNVWQQFQSLKSSKWNFVYIHDFVTFENINTHSLQPEVIKWDQSQLLIFFTLFKIKHELHYTTIACYCNWSPHILIMKQISPIRTDFSNLACFAIIPMFVLTLWTPPYHYVLQIHRSFARKMQQRSYDSSNFISRISSHSK